MITFLVSITLLVAGYFTYGKYINKMFGADPLRPTPATEMADGVDYQTLKPWKMTQSLLLHLEFVWIKIRLLQVLCKVY